MLLKLDFPFKDLTGTELPGNTAAKLVAEILASKTPGINPVKAFEMAQKLYADGCIDIDTIDGDAVERVINDSELITNLVKAQISAAFRTARNDSGATQ